MTMTNDRPTSVSRSTASTDPAAPPPRWRRILLAIGRSLVQNIVLVVFLTGLGFGIGRWTVQPAPDTDTSAAAAPVQPEQATDAGPEMWTCSMHPQIKLPKPGQCPICLMDLIPLTRTADDAPRQLVMSPAAMKLAEIVTAPVERKFVAADIRMVGKVDYDETRLGYLTAYVPGRLDRLYVDYTGVPVKKGDHMVYIYSPELIAAQEELLQALRAVRELQNSNSTLVKQTAAATVESARERLRLWSITQEQIDEIEQRGKPTDHLTLYAPMGGIVIHKNAIEGMYVQTGTRIYTIADLSKVWVKLDAYESDLPWIRYGQEVEFETEAYPGETFTGRISFIDPVLNPQTRTIKLRVNVDNAAGKLKPEMFLRAVVRSRIARGGHVMDASLAGKWISPMHPEIVKDQPGACDICGMPLVRAESLGFVSPQQESEKPLVIPTSAPLITGRRAVVYVKVPNTEKPTFRGQDIVLGPRANDFYIVESGLKEGEQVVVHGNFKIDSELQIAAQPSMMSPAAEEAPEHAPAIKRLDVPAAFRQHIGKLFDAYLKLQTALAGDDAKEATAASAGLPPVLEAIDMKLLTGPAHMAWMKDLEQLQAGLQQLSSAKDIDAQRTAFAPFSDALSTALKRYGHDREEPVRQMKCPMALDNQGAFWLQLQPEVNNPYFGESMLRCGEQVEAIAGAATPPKKQPVEHPHEHPAQPQREPTQAEAIVPAAFRHQLGDVARAYVTLQTRLAGDDVAGAVAAVPPLQTALDAIDMKLLTGPAHMTWMKEQKGLQNIVQKLANAKDIEQHRQAFALLSEGLAVVLERFGHDLAQPVLQMKCPMAFNDRGATWLQLQPEVNNPYFGAAMQRCGKQVGVIEGGSSRKE